MGRPCRLDTVNFDRKLKDAERAILLTAGQGDLTRGFHTVLEIYRVLHNKGYRPDMPMDAVEFAVKGYAENA
jgi:hypothetical protein